MMLSLMALVLSYAPPDSVVFACEHYNSPAKTDGVGSFVDLRAVLYSGERWTLEFKEGSEVEAAFSWVDEAKGIGRMEWQGPGGTFSRSVQFVPGTATMGRLTFWLSMASDGRLDAPGYLCNGALGGEL
jgi:hypothetical protein